MKNAVLLYAKGLAMGAADVVPGVSGGTIAFITGIYEELLGSISAIPAALRLLLRGRIAQAWQTANANFLLVLFAGILSSVFAFAGLIGYLLTHQPVLIWAFFFGLILVSCRLVGREIEHWGGAVIPALLAGALLAWWLSVAAPVQWSGSLLNVFIGGALAICAMILPGISGSFILLLIGLYPLVLGAVRGLEVGVLAVFACGCLLGLLSFARLLSALLASRWRSTLLAFLTGLMVGSLFKVWPWKQTLSWRVDSHGHEVPLLQRNLWPWDYASQVGQDPQWLAALALALAAIVLVLGIEWLGQRRSPERAH